MVKLFRFLLAGRGQRIQRGVEFFQFQQRAQTHAGGEDVIRRLSVIHMVIGMSKVLAELSAHNFRGSVGDNLVGVHVKANARAGLKDVHYKFLVPFSVDDFAGGGNDGIGALVVHQS